MLNINRGDDKHKHSHHHGCCGSGVHKDPQMTLDEPQSNCAIHNKDKNAKLLTDGTEMQVLATGGPFPQNSQDPDSVENTSLIYDLEEEEVLGVEKGGLRRRGTKKGPGCGGLG